MVDRRAGGLVAFVEQPTGYDGQGEGPKYGGKEKAQHAFVVSLCRHSRADANSA